MRKKAASPTPAPTRTVRGGEHIALLASPVRQDLADTLEALGGEADIATLAAQTGYAADGLYYHAELLVKAGLLERSDDDAGSRRYRLAGGRALRLDYGDDDDSREAVGRVVDKLLQTARRDFHVALADSGTVRTGPARELWAGRVRGWLDERDLVEANRLMTALQDLLRGPRRPGRERVFGFSFVLAPVAVRRRKGGSRP